MTETTSNMHKVMNYNISTFNISMHISSALLKVIQIPEYNII